MEEVSRLAQIFNQVCGRIDSLNQTLKVLNTSKNLNFLSWAEWTIDDTIKNEYELKEFVDLKEMIVGEIDFGKEGLTKHYIESQLRFWDTEFSIFRVPSSTNHMKNFMTLLRLETRTKLRREFQGFLAHLNKS